MVLYRRLQLIIDNFNERYLSMLPLIYLGAGLAGLYAGVKLSEKRQKDRGEVALFPGESRLAVTPVDGAIVCCGVYGVLDHTGIWLEDCVIELNGDGLVRAVSPQRFLRNRSGDTIYIACDSDNLPISSAKVAENAAAKLFQYSNYHLLNNNCHRFVLSCMGFEQLKTVRFTDLNQLLSSTFMTSIHWHPIQIRNQYV